MLKTQFAAIPIALLCSATLACSGADVDSEDGTPGLMSDMMDPMDDGGPDNMDDGLPDPNGGLEWAPGAADPCAEPLDTGFPNDNLCLEPPPAEQGFQVHFGPSDYDNPEEIEKFVIEPGDENVVCQYTYTPDFEGVRYTNEQHTRTRTGTHHMIMWMANQDIPGAPAEGELKSESCQNPFEYLFATGAQAALGDEGGIQDIPLPGGDPPENDGTAKVIYPNRSVAVEMHYVNTTQEPLLRESWINSVYMDESEVETVIDPIFFIGANINVPPGGRQIVTADRCEQPPIPADSAEDRVRILGITGHAHANTTRITAWVDRAATGEREKVYEVYDWAEPLNAQFSSVHENPPMNGDGLTDGAITGQLVMDPGDTFSWECEVENQTDVTLTFGNLAYTAEMCNIFGFAVPGSGGMWSCFR